MENWRRPALKSRKFAFKLGFWPYSGSVALAFKNDFKTKFNESTGFDHICVLCKGNSYQLLKDCIETNIFLTKYYPKFYTP